MGVVSSIYINKLYSLPLCSWSTLNCVLETQKKCLAFTSVGKGCLFNMVKVLFICKFPFYSFGVRTAKARDLCSTI